MLYVISTWKMDNLMEASQYQTVWQQEWKIYIL